MSTNARERPAMSETRDRLMLAIRATRGEIIRAEQAVEHFARHYDNCIKSLAELRAKVAELDSLPATPEQLKSEAEARQRVQARLKEFMRAKANEPIKKDVK